MLSINIPVYNVDINNLVPELIQQGEKSGVPFEVRVYDDCSEMTIKIGNRGISDYPNTVYVELEKNMGRSAIRNKMGRDSKYEWLLFIDADSKISSPKYLENYLKNKRHNKVLCGGTTYKTTPPEELEKLLRWEYGIKREALEAKDRNRDKGFIITSNNFLIEKRLFEKVNFREELRNYGHEDTLLGYDLFFSGTEIHHIDNPVEHTGLEDSEIFLAKTKLALNNLNLISGKILKGNPEFVERVRFLKKYKRVSKFISPVLLKIFFAFFHHVLEENLKGKNPRMFWFDLYKLTYFSTIKKP